ncbi:hypothetical protein CUMW_273730 [Citrus unshiu]|uniref:Uncharacterized protein n=1 Tax=Citrus unshiu TaxID=55188 RepID=A0A2H5MY62_CITUN|nr:hypothetical protein CUMW_273730 [Citrus unshiu]GAY32451.1 hypothetical protein CUMW_273730 [Citrus unshiu]
MESANHQLRQDQLVGSPSSSSSSLPTPSSCYGVASSSTQNAWTPIPNVTLSLGNFIYKCAVILKFTHKIITYSTAAANSSMIQESAGFHWINGQSSHEPLAKIKDEFSRFVLRNLQKCQAAPPTLSVPYMKSSRSKPSRTMQGGSIAANGDEEPKRDLRSRGLCLVPLSCMSYVTNDDCGGDQNEQSSTPSFLSFSPFGFMLATADCGHQPFNQQQPTYGLREFRRWDHFKDQFFASCTWQRHGGLTTLCRPRPCDEEDSVLLKAGGYFPRPWLLQFYSRIFIEVKSGADGFMIKMGMVDTLDVSITILRVDICQIMLHILLDCIEDGRWTVFFFQ